ncbi:MAG TPA: SDR family oxidoreductase [Nitrospirales bacterium]|nr:SDR family oxidoreductase [Nitrospirales bacterium]
MGGDDRSDLRGKRVLLTGASRGLGQSCAEAFAREGAMLLLTARSRDQLERIASSLANADQHHIYAGDLTKREEVKALIDAASRLGALAVLLPVLGGGLGMRDPLLTWDEFDTLFATNLASAAAINRGIIPSMVERQTGNVVHVGSIASTEAVGSVGYNVAKAGLAAYIRTLGRTLAHTGVVVTGILPGGFVAPENSMERFKARDPERYEQIMAERQPRKKMGVPDEIMPLLMFLASRQATMMTGCCVPIDGGEGLTYAN